MTQRSLREVIAVAGIALVALLVPVVPLGLTIGPLDVVTLVVPLAILASLPQVLSLKVARAPAVRFGVVAPATVFLAVGLVSVIANPIGIEPLLTLVRYAAYVALIVVTGLVARGEWARRAMAWALAASSSLAVAFSFYQFARPTKSIGMSELEGLTTTRVFSTFDNPNFYGEFLIILIPVLIWLVSIERGSRRLVAGGMTLAAVASLLLTYTRGSWVALAAGLMLAMYMVRMRHRWLVPVIGAAAVAAVPGVLARVASIFSLAGTASFRLGLWRIAGEVIARHPVFGVGMGRFYDGFRETVVARPDLAIGYLEYGAHNSFLTVAAEAGVIGGLAFAWLVFAIARRGLVLSEAGLSRRQQLENGVYTGALVAFAINGLSSNAFQHPKGAVLFWLVAGLQFGVQNSLSEFADSPTVPFARVWRASVCGGVLAKLGSGFAAAYPASMTARVARSVTAVYGASYVGRATAWFTDAEGTGDDRVPAWLAASVTMRVLRPLSQGAMAMWRASRLRHLLFAPAPMAGGIVRGSVIAGAFGRLVPGMRAKAGE